LLTSAGSTLAAKNAMFIFLSSLVACTSDLHSAVQPPVKALGYHAMT
jgi:hypothetical protein